MLEQFYYSTTKKVLAGFGSLFNDIWIVRSNSSDTEVSRFKVPLSYAPKQKYVVRESQSNPDLEHNIEMILPRMAYNLVSMQYDSTRKLETSRRTVQYNSASSLDQRRDRVPYSLSVELYIITKNEDDAYQILEQILPYFSPDFTITYKSFPIDALIDTPITLSGISLEDLYEGTMDERKTYTITLSFTIQSYYYGPVHDSKVITRTKTNFIDYNGLFLSALGTGPSGLEMYTFQATGGTMSQLQVNVTGGATAGSFGPTGTWETIITDYEY